MSDLKSVANELSKTMACNCDLDDWQPEILTGHSMVCRIHRAATASEKAMRQITNNVREMTAAALESGAMEEQLEETPANGMRGCQETDPGTCPAWFDPDKR